MQERNLQNLVIGVLNDNSWMTKLKLECGRGFNHCKSGSLFTTKRLELGRSLRIESREADAHWKVMIMRFFMSLVNFPFYLEH